MLKKVMVVLSMVLALGVVEVKAETVSHQMQENRVKCKKAELEYDILDYLGEKEAKVRAIDFSVDYEDLGDGIYDIYIIYKLYNKYTYEIHSIYDAIEDEDLIDYGITGNNRKRVTIKELDKELEDKFPEFK